jgi:hypothetical protein
MNNDVTKEEVLEALLWARDLRRTDSNEKPLATVEKLLRGALVDNGRGRSLMYEPVRSNHPWQGPVLSMLKQVGEATTAELRQAVPHVSYHSHFQQVSRLAKKGAIERVPNTSPIRWRLVKGASQ